MPEAGPSTAAAPAAGPMAEEVQPEQSPAAEVPEDINDEEHQDTTPAAPPRILLTTSPAPCKETYQFCDDLKNVFPGGDFFKRPKGRGFELGRVARWAAKRAYGAVIIVNEDHKKPSELGFSMLLIGRDRVLTVSDAITVIQLPAGPTAYFKLTSVQLGSQIYVSDA